MFVKQRQGKKFVYRVVGFEPEPCHESIAGAAIEKPGIEFKWRTRVGIRQRSLQKLMSLREDSALGRTAAKFGP